MEQIMYGLPLIAGDCTIRPALTTSHNSEADGLVEGFEYVCGSVGLKLNLWKSRELPMSTEQNKALELFEKATKKKGRLTPA